MLFRHCNQTCLPCVISVFQIKLQECPCKSNFIRACVIRPCKEKKLSQNSPQLESILPRRVSKNTPTSQSPVVTGYPLASNSLPLATQGAPCQALMASNLLALVPSLCMGWGRRRSWPVVGTTCAPLPSVWAGTASLPHTGLEWAARRKLGFLAKAVTARLALDRLEKWGARIFPHRQSNFQGQEHPESSDFLQLLACLVVSTLFLYHLTCRRC